MRRTRSSKDHSFTVMDGAYSAHQLRLIVYAHLVLAALFVLLHALQYGLTDFWIKHRDDYREFGASRLLSDYLSASLDTQIELGSIAALPFAVAVCGYLLLRIWFGWRSASQRYRQFWSHRTLLPLTKAESQVLRSSRVSVGIFLAFLALLGLLLSAFAFVEMQLGLALLALLLPSFSACMLSPWLKMQQKCVVRAKLDRELTRVTTGITNDRNEDDHLRERDYSVTPYYQFDDPLLGQQRQSSFPAKLTVGQTYEIGCARYSSCVLSVRSVLM
jgi:hypothetical protein